MLVRSSYHHRQRERERERERGGREEMRGDIWKRAEETGDRNNNTMFFFQDSSLAYLFILISFLYAVIRSNDIKAGLF